MAESCLLYYITDRAAFPGDERERRRHLLGKIGEAAVNGINYIQLREKDLPARELEALAREAVRIIRAHSELATGNRQLATALLINSRTDVVLAVSAAGVHLRADDVSPQDVRAVSRCRADRASEFLLGSPLIAVSCHSLEQVFKAAANGASFAVFAPVFEKKDAPAAIPAGLDALRRACDAKLPVLALGGITLKNAESCFRAGAAGIAATRLFQENEISKVVRALRG